MRVALYARVSTTDQTCEQQLTALREYCTARGWTDTTEHIDSGVSGAKDRRPALDQLMRLARTRKVDTILCWKLDRWGRSVQHLVNSLRELADLGVRFVCPTQGIDTDHSNPAGKLMLHMLAAFAEFERDLIVERTKVGMDRARKNGAVIGRPRAIFDRTRAVELRAQGLSLAQIAAELGATVATVHRVVGRLPISESVPSPATS